MGLPLKLIKILATEGLEAWKGGEWSNTYIPLTHLAKRAGGPTKLLKTLMKTSAVGGALGGAVVGGATTLVIKDRKKIIKGLRKEIKKRFR